MRARYIVGDALDVLRSMPDGSVDCVVTSPPYHLQRAYLPAEHPAQGSELGQEPTPAAFLDALLDVMDELHRVLDDLGTFWVNLGDKHAGSGGAGGDYNEGGLRDGQQRYDSVAKRAAAAGVELRPSQIRTRGVVDGWPLEQSVAWEPALFGASLAYGRNLLNGNPHRQWVTRPPVTWCKPSPSVGSLTRRFRSATELIIYGGKRADHYFDLDAVRVASDYHRESKYIDKRTAPGQRPNLTQHTVNPGGTPPLNWWVVSHPGYTAAHFATFPPELIVRPILAGCRPGGVVLDPFAGSGTTLAVATGHGRDAIGIDLDERNAELARQRVGMWLTVEGEDDQAVADVATGGVL